LQMGALYAQNCGKQKSLPENRKGFLNEVFLN
jgi:hypothetical protein